LLIVAETRELFSRPMQGSVEVPMDIFKVRTEYGPNIQIRLDGEKVYVSVSACDHPSRLKSVSVPYDYFVEHIGQTFFGDGWRQ